MKAGWYKSRTVKVLTHVAVWAVALSLPYLLDTHHGMHHHNDNDQYDRGFFYLNLVTNILWTGPFYINAYLLMPRLFYRRRYLLFAAANVLLFAAIMLIHVGLFHYVFALPCFSIQGALGFLMPPFIIAITVSTAYRLLQDRLEADQHNQDKQEENLKTELSFLRSQINPHFIFNILNNLVALEQMKSDELGPTILKLSSLMQYMLYETDGEKVPLDNEVDYLQSYIDLQRQRFGEKVPVAVFLEPPVKAYEIEPMLLIPFVENAFKHGMGMIAQPAIEISLQVREDVLHFTVRNKYNPLSAETKDKTSGIGLGNVSRRLNLLYGTRQELHIIRQDDWFTIDLKLNLR